MLSEPVSSLLHSTELRVEQSQSILAFQRVGPETNPGFDRYLTIEGKQAFHIGNICGTCEFFFRRLNGANQKISPSELSERFRQGITTLDAEFLANLAPVLPNANYRVTLLKLTPQLVRPGESNDYFVNEQVELWGIDSFWNLPKDPRSEYYRTAPRPLGDRRELYEFLVPLVPSNWLHADTVTRYEQRIADDQQPTALAIATLDIKQPADWEDEPTITEHWCLAHYMLDGHHKTLAAARAGRPITLISFLAVDKSIATPEDIEFALTALAAT
jgi:hypothetical protein